MRLTPPLNFNILTGVPFDAIGNVLADNNDPGRRDRLLYQRENFVQKVLGRFNVLKPFEVVRDQNDWWFFGPVLSFFKKAKAEILSGPTSLGRKKLAYPILKQKHGFYVVLEFKLEDTQELKELETSLRHNKNILRHLVIKRRLLNVFDKNGEKNFADEVKKAAPSKRTDSRSNRNNRSAYAPRPSFKKAEAVKVEPATAERGPAIGGSRKKIG